MKDNTLILKTLLATIIYLISFFVDSLTSVFLMSIAFTIVSYNLVVLVIQNLFKLKVLYDDIFILIISFTLFFLGFYQEAVALIIIYSICQIFIILTIRKIKHASFKHINSKYEKANLLVANKVEKVDVSLLKIGDLIKVYKGERIPCDGIIVDGYTKLDTYDLTGDHSVVNAKVGDSVLSETLNLDRVITIRITKSLFDSSSSIISRSLASVKSDSKVAQKIFNFNLVFTLIALITLILVHNFYQELNIYLILSIILILSPSPTGEPLKFSYFTTVSNLIKKGLLIKKTSTLDTVLITNTLLLDKSTTLSDNTCQLVELVMKEDEDLFREDLALALGPNNHRLALYIKDYYSIQDFKTDKYRTLEGGFWHKYNNTEYLMGNKELFEKERINVPLPKKTGSVIYLAKNKKFFGYLVIKDNLKTNVTNTLKRLQSLGLNEIIILSSDNYDYVKEVCDSLNIDRFMADLSKEDKLEYITKAQKEGQRCIFIGEGKKDTALIKKADLGISVGNMGSYLDLEQADVIILNDDLLQVETLIKEAQRNRKIILENILLSFFLKTLMFVSLYLGIFNLLIGVLVNASIYLLSLINSAYILGNKKTV